MLHLSINCQWSPWGNWEVCSDGTSCELGTYIRMREKQPPLEGGEDCEGENSETSIGNFGDKFF